MQKNDCIIGIAEAFGSNGEGIVRADGVTVFVPRLIYGEKAKIRILKIKDRIAYGKIEEILTPAEERVRPRCPVFEKCGGCQLQHLKYRTQLKLKTQMLKDTLRKVGGIEAAVNECERSEKEYGYRNKLQLPIGHKDGGNAIGFFAERSHRIVKTDACPIHPEWSEKLIEAVYRFMEKCGLDGYDEDTRQGQLRHIVVREIRGRFLVTLVTTTRDIKGIDYFLYLLDGVFSEYSFYLNYNPSDTNVVFGSEFTLVKGKGFYDCTDSGITFEAGVNTFLQVNENVSGKLYDKIVSFIEEGERVVDCYSGGGLLTARLAQKCGRAYGIEIVSEASACANAVARKNGLQEKMFNLCGKVEELLPSVLEREGKVTLVLDPPRAGVERRVLRAIERSGAEKVIMVSCNPATLARDLGILTGTLQESETGELLKSDGNGVYEIKYIQPYDMFPQTKWCETLVVLSKKIPTSHINVEVEFGENEGQFSLDKIKERAEARKPKEKVTYKMIQSYIEETYGFKVHTAYIAEVKRDLGLPMYDAPNAVEELKRPRSHPTPKMVEAIKEALKHFEII